MNERKKIITFTLLASTALTAGALTASPITPKEKAELKSEKKQAKASSVNDKAAGLRLKADEEERNGRLEKAATLRSQANDLEARATSLSNDAKTQ